MEVWGGEGKEVLKGMFRKQCSIFSFKKLATFKFFLRKSIVFRTYYIYTKVYFYFIQVSQKDNICMMEYYIILDI